MKTYQIVATHFAEKLKLKEAVSGLENPHLLSTWEAAFKFSEDSYAFLYNFGSVVFFNVPEEKQKPFLETLKKRSSTPANTPDTTTSDTFIVEIDSTAQKNDVGFNKVTLGELNYPKARLISMVVAESTALEYFELICEDLLIKTNYISDSLRTKGKLLKETKNLLKFIGFCLTTKQEIITNLYVVDAPDEVWDDQLLDRLYGDLKRMFEIETRYKVLEYKLRLIQESVEIIVDLSKSRRETYLELTIIVLIAFEIFWTVLGKSFH